MRTSRILLMMIILLSSSVLSAVSDIENLTVTGLLVRDGRYRNISYIVSDFNGSSLNDGEFSEASSVFIGEEPSRMFHWNMNGNPYLRKNSGMFSIVTEYTMGPLMKEGSTSEMIPYRYRFVPEYTYIGNTYLGQEGAILLGTNQIYRDNITASARSSGQTVSGISIRGTVDSSVSHTLRYTYTMNRKLGYRYIWYRTGDIFICIPESGYSNASPGVYRATITIGISSI